MSAAVPEVSDSVARTWGTNGKVYGLANSGDDVILGGTFTEAVSPGGRSEPHLNIAKYSLATGAIDSSWNVSVVGVIQTVTIANGIVYFGGDFNTVNGVKRRHAAAVSLATGALQPWEPKPDRPVAAIRVAGGFAYLTGQFVKLTDAVGPVTVGYAARVDAVSGAVDRPWTSHAVLNARGRAIAVAPDGSAVFVGGDFTTLNGAAGQVSLVKLATSAVGGPVPGFVAGPNNGTKKAPVTDLTTSADAVLVAAAGAGGGCAAQNATTGATRWSVKTNGNVQGVAVLGDRAFCVGHFNGTGAFGGLDRTKIGDVDLATGAVGSFAPRVNSALGIWEITATPVGLLVGGEFTIVNNTPQASLGQFRMTSALTVPGLPEGIASVHIPGQITVTWDPPSTDGGSDLKKYAVYRSIADGPVTLLGRTSAQSWVDTGATPGAAYSYFVAAENLIGASDRAVTSGIAD